MKKIIFCLILFIYTTNIYAVSKYAKPYGMSGCGMGSLVFYSESDHQNQFLQIVSVFLNNVWGSQTLGITSGTSNCVDSNTVAANESEVFLEANLNNIEKEAAKGHGAHLTAFADVLGCESELKTFETLSQNKYPIIFSELEAKSVLNRYLNEIKSHEILARSCIRI